MEQRRFLFVLVAALGLVTALVAHGEGGKGKFGATLKGSNEVPSVDSKATGNATITVSGTSVEYKITASGLSGNATASHIHIGPATASGPVVVPFPASAIKNAPDGSVTISGTFTAADIKPQANPPIKTLDDLLGQMKAGNTYVNVHTAAHPGGEIRGQLTGQ